MRDSAKESPLQRLIKYWATYEIGASGRQVHQEDHVELLSSSVTSPTLDSFLKSPPEESELFHLALTPVPYVGDLETADIFLLMLNPSLGAADYGTNEKEDFQIALKQTRNQQLGDKTHKCFALDPKFWWSSWFMYYEKLLRSTIWEHANSKGVTYAAALEELASRLAILELVPYYSASASQIRPALIRRLCSAQLAREAASELAARANQGTATVIMRWGADKWKLDKKNKIVRPESVYGFETCKEAIVKRLAIPAVSPAPNQESEELKYGHTD